MVDDVGPVAGHGLEMNKEFDAVLAAAVQIIDMQGRQVQFAIKGLDVDHGIQGNPGEGGERRARIIVGQEFE